MGNSSRVYFLLGLVVASASCSKLPKENGKTIPISPHLVGSEYLDTQQKYLLSWNVNTEEKAIYFEVTAETKGFVGFGISPSGSMLGADLLIAGVKDDGTLYSKDYHGVGNTAPVEDTEDNWNVTSGNETGTHTKLNFNRLLNTCDEDDFKITDATMRVIWSLGETDDVAYHGPERRGTKSVNFFLQGEDEFDSEKYEKIDISVQTVMPSQHTGYWCTIHELPLFQEKQHIVGFEPILENEPALQHTHHFIFHRCIAPEGEDPEEFFRPWVSHEGDYCYDQVNASFPFRNFCNGNMIYVWSKGGKRMVFPENLGLPMPETPGQPEYYAMEVHYDNPAVIENLKFKTGGRIFYTSELRDEEAGLIVVDQKTRIQLTVPPQSENFVVNGHCSPECTQQLLPEEGVTIFNNLLHAHLAGRKLKLRHFRGNQELAPVDTDDYYDFDFQQNKPLTEPRKLERGDQLTIECTYDSMKAEGKRAVIGGLSSHEEMCQGWFFYYPKQDLSNCGSTQTTEEHFKLLGVTEWKPVGSGYAGGNERYNITKPDHLAGDYLESVSFKVEWTKEFRERFQQEKRFGEHQATCSRNGRQEEEFKGVVKYPDTLINYEPPNECEGKNPPGGGDNGNGATTAGISNLMSIFMLVLALTRVLELFAK